MRVVLALVAAAALAFAGATHHYTVNFDHPYVLHQTVLQPGHYRLVVTNDHAVLQKGHQEVATNLKVKTVNRKFNYTGIVSTAKDNKLVAIELGGTNKKVIVD